MACHKTQSASRCGAQTEARSFQRHYTVFNSNQCEGIPIPEDGQQKIYENKPVEAAERIALSMPKKPLIEHGHRNCAYNPQEDLVKMPSLDRFESAAEYYAGLFHELAHSTGHVSRLNRRELMIREYGETIQRYGREELVAEMASAYICAHCGLSEETIENNAAYLNGWIKALRSDSRLAIQAAAAAQKAANYILRVDAE